MTYEQTAFIHRFRKLSNIVGYKQLIGVVAHNLLVLADSSEESTGPLAYEGIENSTTVCECGPLLTLRTVGS